MSTMLKKYAYHRILMCFLGEYDRKELRRQDCFADNISDIKEHEGKF